MSNDSSKAKLKPVEPPADKPPVLAVVEPKAKKKLSDKVTWGIKAAIFVTLLSFIAGQILAAVAVGLGPALFGMNGDEIEAWLNTTGGQFTFVVFAEAITMAILWRFLRKRGSNLRSLGFHRSPIWKDLGYALACFSVYFVMLIAATVLSENYLGVDTEQEQDLGFDNLVGPLGMLMAFVSLVILPPVVEEIVFRGFLFGGLRRKMTFVGATIITSILFAIPHLLTGEAGVLLWIAAIDTLILSFVLCYAREKTGNLWAPIGIHAIKNGLAFLYLFVIK